MKYTARTAVSPISESVHPSLASPHRRRLECAKQQRQKPAHIDDLTLRHFRFGTKLFRLLRAVILCCGHSGFRAASNEFCSSAVETPTSIPLPSSHNKRDRNPRAVAASALQHHRRRRLRRLSSRCDIVVAYAVFSCVVLHK